MDINKHKLYFDEDKKENKWFVVQDPYGRLLLDTISWCDFYAQDRLIYGKRGWWARVFDVPPKPWRYYKDKDFKMLRIKITKLKYEVEV